MADDAQVLKEGSSNEAATEEALPPATTDKTSRFKTKRFWLRCCICCAVLVVILVAILVPVLLLVAFPKIAQAAISGSSLHFQTINITQPADSSFVMHVVGSVSNAGPIGATIHFPSPVSVFWNDSLLLGNITLSDLNVNGGSGSIDSDSNFVVVNNSAFTDFNKYLLSAPSFTWRLVGPAEITALGRHVSGLSLDKTVTYDGMNGFPGVKILNISLPVTNTPSLGVELDLQIQMQNPSPLGIQLGTLNLNLTYEGTYLGPATASNFFLASGENEVTIKAILISQPTSEGAARVADLLSRFIEGLPSTTIAHGVSAFPDGHDAVSWLTPAIQNLVMTVNLTAPDASTLNETARNFAQSSINGASLVFNSVNITNEAATSFTSALDVLLNNTGPLPATIEFPSPVQIYYNGAVLGTVQMPSVNVVGGQGHLIGPNSTFEIADPTQFATFTSTLLSTKSFNWTLVGTANAVALNRTFTGLTMNKTVTLNGMDSFQNVQIQKFTLPGDISSIAGGGIEMDITAVMNNLSPLGVQLGTVDFQISYQSVVIGPVSTTSFFLAPGSNLVQMTGKMVPQTDPNALNIVSQLFSAYIAGQTVNTTVKGVSAAPDGTNQISWLQPGIQSLELSVPLNNLASSNSTT